MNRYLATPSKCTITARPPTNVGISSLECPKEPLFFRTYSIPRMRPERHVPADSHLSRLTPEAIMSTTNVLSTSTGPLSAPLELRPAPSAALTPMVSASYRRLHITSICCWYCLCREPAYAWKHSDSVWRARLTHWKHVRPS